MQEASGSWNWWVVFFVAMIVLLSLSFAFADPPPPMQLAVALNAGMSVPEPTAGALTCSTLLIVLIIGGKQNRLHDSL